ncbi:MAG: tRNA lysidine(34) synthetase TilS [Clostridia bacterium]|nr:tRNA lysidine(34) synthetase TilS [Clostridia bacterium]
MLDCACFSKYKTLAIAVSGGKDSMALLHYFIANSARLPKFYVINFEHGIRGEESKSDSEFVKCYCDDAGLECEIVSLDCMTYCKGGGYTLEQGARLLRRAYYEDTVRQSKADRVLTAHHKSDNAESILMHIARGSGLKGICGIPTDDGVVMRPLLNISREEIEQYCKVNNVPFREDKSNADTSYDRNYMRNVIIPKLKDRYGALEDNLIGMASRASDAEEFIRSRCIKADIVHGVAKLPLSALSSDKILAQYSVIDALERLGSRVDITAGHIEDIIALKDKKNGAKIDLPHGYCACKAYCELHIYRQINLSIKQSLFGIGEVEWGNAILRVSPDVLPSALRIDGEKVPQGAVWRTRRQGDTFLPFGGGRRTLGDWLTDKKVPLYRRDTLPLLALGNEILAVLPYEISRSLAVDDTSERILYLSMESEQQ